MNNVVLALAAGLRAAQILLRETEIIDLSISSDIFKCLRKKSDHNTDEKVSYITINNIL